MAVFADVGTSLLVIANGHAAAAARTAQRLTEVMSAAGAGGAASANVGAKRGGDLVGLHRSRRAFAGPDDLAGPVDDRHVVARRAVSGVDRP